MSIYICIYGDVFMGMYLWGYHGIFFMVESLGFSVKKTMVFQIGCIWKWAISLENGNFMRERDDQTQIGG